MNKMKKQDYIKKISDTAQNVDINLTLIMTLLNFIEYGLSDKYNFNNRDIENLLCVIKKMMSLTIKDYSELEVMLDVS